MVNGFAKLYKIKKIFKKTKKQNSYTFYFPYFSLMFGANLIKNGFLGLYNNNTLKSLVKLCQFILKLISIIIGSPTLIPTDIIYIFFFTHGNLISIQQFGLGNFFGAHLIV